jgi:hypothetical protein
MPAPAAARALFSSLIDYAGLFPPAGLSMAPAVANYARYVQSPERWMLARFIVPAARLADFEVAAMPFWNEHGHEWHISALVGEQMEDDLVAIRAFNAAHAAANRAQIDSIECKLIVPADAERIARLIPHSIAAYLEFADLSEAGCATFLDAIVAAGAHSEGAIRAKIRTGGVKAEMIPAAERVVGFIAACAARKLAFKATAGLHHASPGSYPLTYEPDAACGSMHGFVNLFLAAGALWHGASAEHVRSLFQTSDASSLLLTHAGVTWDGGGLTTEQVADFRSRFAIAFGSCSFEEPVADLRAMGWL